MTRKDLDKIIKTEIPLTQHMGLSVMQCSVQNGVKFSLPLKANKNHKNTAFGGSLVAAQALVSWAWLMALLSKNKIEAEVVVQRQSSEFIRPVNGDFIVATEKLAKTNIEQFLNTLKRHGKARINICAHVTTGRRLDAVYSGEYVAIRMKGKSE